MQNDLGGFWKEESGMKADRKAAQRNIQKKKGKKKRKPNDSKKRKARRRLERQGKDVPDSLMPNHATTNAGTKKNTNFYSSMKWRQMRYLALRNTNATCECCGARSSDGVRLHVDHIVPKAQRPDLSLSLDNLQVLCEDCNVGKGSWDDTNWRQHWESM